MGRDGAGWAGNGWFDGPRGDGAGGAWAHCGDVGKPLADLGPGCDPLPGTGLDAA